MAIQIVPKEREKSPFWLDLAFYLSTILLVAVTASYFVLISLQKKAEKDYKALEQQLSEIRSPEKILLEEKVVKYKTKIDDFSKVFSSRSYITQIFPLIESLTHPKVSFSRLSGGTDGKVTILGTTDNFQTLSQQIVAFKNNNLVQETNFSNVVTDDEGKVSFGLELILSPEIFIKK